MRLNSDRNISVSPGHQYTFEKVKYAVDFVNKAGRNTTINDWVEAYNYLRGANETAQGCQACKAAKFTAAVRNYARYGYMTLLNFGYTPEDFKDNGNIVEDSKVEEVMPVEDVQGAEEVVSTVTETAGQGAILAERQGEPTVEDAILAERQLPQPSKQSAASKDVERTKVRKKKNDKSDNK